MNSFLTKKKEPGKITTVIKSNCVLVRRQQYDGELNLRFDDNHSGDSIQFCINDINDIEWLILAATKARDQFYALTPLSHTEP